MSGLYYAMQVPYKVLRHYPCVPMVSTANVVRVKLSSKRGLHPSLYTAAAAPLLAVVAGYGGGGLKGLVTYRITGTVPKYKVANPVASPIQ